METIQLVIGIAVSFIVAIISFFPARWIYKNVREGDEEVKAFAAYIVAIIACYLLIALIGGFLWVLALIGIFFREVFMWLVEAIFWFIP